VIRVARQVPRPAARSGCRGRAACADARGGARGGASGGGSRGRSAEAVPGWPLRHDQRCRLSGRPACQRAADSPRNLLTSLILVFPLFLIYQVGVLFTLTDAERGGLRSPHFSSRTFGLTLTGYLGFLGVFWCCFLATVALLGRRQHFNRAVVVPSPARKCGLALTMGSLIVFVMTKVLGISPRLAGGSKGRDC